MAGRPQYPSCGSRPLKVACRLRMNRRKVRGVCRNCSVSKSGAGRWTSADFNSEGGLQPGRHAISRSLGAWPGCHGGSSEGPGASICPEVRIVFSPERGSLPHWPDQAALEPPVAPSARARRRREKASMQKKAVMPIVLVVTSRTQNRAQIWLAGRLLLN